MSYIVWKLTRLRSEAQAKLSNIWLDIQYKDNQEKYPLKKQNVQKHGLVMDIP